MVKKLLKPFFLICISFAMTATSEARDKTCNLQLSIFEYGKSQRIPINKVDLILTNSKTKEKTSYNSTSVIFENLSSGKYRIEANAEDYKQRFKTFELDCNFTDKDNIFSEYLNLWKKNKSKVDLKNDLPEDSAQISAQTKGLTGNAEAKASQNVGEVKDISPKGSDKVNVQITIDEDGNVISARAVDGNSFFASKAVNMARQSKFAPTMLAGVSVKVTGIVIYNFIKK